jgi:16S rRNA (adenine1518-N6/adenine1519-N6)-dimethyltransferase
MFRKPNVNSDKVTAKKQLGQHFLTDKGIAQKIGDLLIDDLDGVIEIGPGMGVMTTSLYEKWGNKLAVIEIDKESCDYLGRQEWAEGLKVIEGDFLEIPYTEWPEGEKLAIIGNYPYNISTQIVFRMLESGKRVEQFAGMFQKEVAKRFCAEHGNKEYGITSVILQAYYNCKYEFTVNEGSFNPPPKVKSGVMSCILRDDLPECSYKNLKLVVKHGFSQRRKTLHNALKPLTSANSNFIIPEKWQSKRAEQLSVEEFKELSIFFEKSTH